jgi:hypothetical protein
MTSLWTTILTKEIVDPHYPGDKTYVAPYKTAVSTILQLVEKQIIRMIAVPLVSRKIMVIWQSELSRGE